MPLHLQSKIAIAAVAGIDARLIFQRYADTLASVEQCQAFQWKSAYTPTPIERCIDNFVHSARSTARKVTVTLYSLSYCFVCCSFRTSIYFRRMSKSGRMSTQRTWHTFFRSRTEYSQPDCFLICERWATKTPPSVHHGPVRSKRR